MTKRLAVGLAHLVNRADVRMAQTRDRARLALEAGAPLRSGGEISRQDLDGEGAAQRVSRAR